MCHESHWLILLLAIASPIVDETRLLPDTLVLKVQYFEVSKKEFAAIPPSERFPPELGQNRRQYEFILPIEKENHQESFGIRSCEVMRLNFKEIKVSTNHIAFLLESTVEKEDVANRKSFTTTGGGYKGPIGAEVCSTVFVHGVYRVVYLRLEWPKY